MFNIHEHYSDAFWWIYQIQTVMQLQNDLDHGFFLYMRLNFFRKYTSATNIKVILFFVTGKQQNVIFNNIRLKRRRTFGDRVFSDC